MIDKNSIKHVIFFSSLINRWLNTYLRCDNSKFQSILAVHNLEIWVSRRMFIFSSWFSISRGSLWDPIFFFNICFSGNMYIMKIRFADTHVHFVVSLVLHKPSPLTFVENRTVDDFFSRIRAFSEFTYLFILYRFCY